MPVGRITFGPHIHAPQMQRTCAECDYWHATSQLKGWCDYFERGTEPDFFCKACKKELDK